MRKNASKKQILINKKVLNTQKTNQYSKLRNKSSIWISFKDSLTYIRKRYLKKYTFFGDINKDYKKLMKYNSIDIFTQWVLIFNLIAVIIGDFFVSYLKLAYIMPSPLSWRVISLNEILIVTSIAAILTFVPIVFKDKFVSHFHWRLFVSLSLSIFCFIAVFLSGGSIEMHFFYFIAIAYLTIYLDWRLIFYTTILFLLYNFIFNYIKPTWIFFYGKNEASLAAHGIPLIIMSLFCIYFCRYHRNILINLENTKKILIQDLKERKIIEENLVESESKYKQLVDSNPIGIAEAKINGGYTYVNDKFLEILEYKREDFEDGKINIRKLTPEEFFSSDENAIAEMRTMGHSYPYEKEMITKRGKRIPVLVGSALVNDFSDEYIFYILDITNERKVLEQLRSSLTEKDSLLREIHHRVKNNLQIISSLLSLQSKRLRDKRYAEAFSDSRNRIRSMAIIHEKLYQSKNLAQIDFIDYIQSLVKYLKEIYKLDKEIIFKIDYNNDIKLGIEIAIPCGLMINELITNCIKHAFNDRDNGEVTISLLNFNDRINIEVLDNGIGLNKNIDFDNIKTLGLQLVRTLVDQIDGTLNIESEKGYGTKFQILFNINK